MQTVAVREKLSEYAKSCCHFYREAWYIVMSKRARSTGQEICRGAFFVVRRNNAERIEKMVHSEAVKVFRFPVCSGYEKNR